MLFHLRIHWLILMCALPGISNLGIYGGHSNQLNYSAGALRYLSTFHSFIHSFILMCTEWLLGINQWLVLKGRMEREVEALKFFPST